MEGGEASSAIPGFSSLYLSRPDSYSAAGKVADASIPVLKQPQPMLYCPASGLVTYQPPGLTGVAHMQWLERLSSPKVVRAKSPKARRTADSLSRTQQQQQQQGQQTHESPARSRSSSPARSQSPGRQPLPLRHCQSPDRHNVSILRSNGQRAALEQQLLPPCCQQQGAQYSAQQQPAQNAQSVARSYEPADTAADTRGSHLAAFSTGAAAAAAAGEAPGSCKLVQRTRHSAEGAEDSRVHAWKVSASHSCQADAHYAQQQHSTGGYSAGPCRTTTQQHNTSNGMMHSIAGSKLTHRGLGSAAGAAAALQDSRAPASGRHTGRTAAGCSQTTSSSSSSSSTMSERMTLTAPYVFTWGGRLKGKHLGMSDMQSSMQNSSTTSSSSSTYSHHAEAAHHSCGGTAAAAAVAAAALPEAQIDGCSGNSKEPMDPATAAAAAALGAEADRLLKAFNVRMEQHHPERSRSKQQGRRRARGVHAHRAAAATDDDDGSGFQDGSGCGAYAGDEPICIPVEYLRL